MKVLNAAGYYTEPRPQNVAVSLLKAKINTNADDPTVYLTQNLDDVYTDPDPRTTSSRRTRTSSSQRSSATVHRGEGSNAGGLHLLRDVSSAAAVGLARLLAIPINLVTASFDQIKKIPGVEVQNISVDQCDNPTFSPDGHNVLADTAPFPQDCDKQGNDQCGVGTGG